MTVVDKDRTYLYVASGHYGLHSKIGVSGNPNQRVGGLRNSYDWTVELEYAVYAPLNGALRAERCAHRLLKDLALGNEWFRVEPNEAIRIVNQAIATVNEGRFETGASWSRWNLASRVKPDKVRFCVARRCDDVPIFEQITST